VSTRPSVDPSVTSRAFQAQVIRRPGSRVSHRTMLNNSLTCMVESVHGLPCRTFPLWRKVVAVPESLFPVAVTTWSGEH
jgi:hypothetical protein